MRALVTGASGFVGGYLVQECARAGDEVLGVSRAGPHAVDLREAAALASLLKQHRPDVIYHLASLSSVSRSWEDPALTVGGNVAIAVSVLEAVREGAPGARLLWVSSCEVYGTATALPATEDAPYAPANPYAVSKTTGEMLAAVYADAYGLDLIRVRPFNHAGPGQSADYVVSALARQAATALHADAPVARLVTGNPDARRDFTDVRDVARAYRLLASRAPAGVYNVASGQSVSAAEQVQLLGELLAPRPIEHAVDPALVRTHEVMELRGDASRLHAATGWQPEIPFRQTVRDTIAWWERELAEPPRAQG